MKKTLTLIGLLVLNYQLQAQSFLTTGLVAYYPLNGNANDASGNGYNSTNYTVVWGPDRFDIASAAGQFDGSASYIILPSTLVNLMSGSSPMTVSSWVKTAVGGNRDILNIGSASDGRDFAILVQANGDFYYSGFGFWDVDSGKQINDNIWHHCVASFDGNNMNLYVDGVLKTSQAIVSNRANTIGTIGIRGDLGGNELWYGGIDDVRIYNRALSSNEVAQLYAYESVNTPIITAQPISSTNLVGTTVTFSITTSTNLSANYQWYFVPANGSGQAGAYAETIAGFCYGAVVTNGGFGYGNIPSVNFVGGGGFGASGYANVSNGIVTGISMISAGSGYTGLPSVVIDAPNGYLYGQTNSTLTVSNANQSSLGNYFVVVTQANNSVTSGVVNLTLVYPPSVSFNPIGFTQNYGTSNTLDVVGAGTSPLSYQWSLNGTNINDATNSSYSINGLDITNTGSYIVEVTNAYGYVYSSPVDVNMLPALTTPFAGAVGLWGQSVGLNVGSVGSGTLNYQWYFNGQPIPEAASNSYTFDSIQFTNAGLYSVVVSSIYGSVTNAAYQVVVNPANISIGLFAGVTIQGTVGNKYNIQSTTNLRDTNSWVTLTNITLTSPIQIWNDNSSDVHSPNNPQKFYQVLPGQ